MTRTDLAGARARTYGLLASVYLCPDAVALAAEAAELRARGEALAAFPFFPRVGAVIDALGAADGGRLERERGELLAACPPYEASYVDPTGLARGAVVAEVEAAYASAGAALASPGELPDHVGLELAFLSLLCAEEEEPRRRELAFLDDHLARWLPAFARRVALVAPPSSLYRLAAEAARAFVVHDRDLLRLLLEECA